MAEARSLARINSKNLGLKYKSKPVEIRRDLLASHFKRKDTQAELDRRVTEKLLNTPKVEAAQVTTQVILLDDLQDELLDFTEFDTEHLLWEEIKALVYLAREIDFSQINDVKVSEILDEIDKIKLLLLKFRRT